MNRAEAFEKFLGGALITHPKWPMPMAYRLGMLLLYDYEHLKTLGKYERGERVIERWKYEDGYEIVECKNKKSDNYVVRKTMPNESVAVLWPEIKSCWGY